MSQRSLSITDLVERGTVVGRVRRCLAVSGAVVLMLALGAAWRATSAGAAIQNFSMSPTSGGPGTSVHVSGTGCAPGVLLSSSQDFVQVAATTLLPASVRFSVAANGSWSGTFVVPANSPALPAAVSAVCFSDSLQSLLTIYLPKVFTVTAASPTTVAPPPTSPPTTHPKTPSTGGTTPVTQPRTGTTKPGSGTPGGTPTTPGPGGTVSTPGDGTGGVLTGVVGDDNSSGTSGDGTAASNSKSPKASDTGAEVARAADLSAPGLSTSGDNSSSGLSWLAWLLLLLALAALVAFVGWLYWNRQHTVEPDASADLQ